MYDRKKLGELQQSQENWRKHTLNPTLSNFSERQDEFITTSSEPVERIYTPLDLQQLDFERDLGMPGEYPYTRGVHATMHRGRLWTMRMFAGFGTAEETNQRFKYLLDQGQTGLSIAFDLPTLMGYDPDEPEALGEFGRCGVAVSSLKDMEILLDGIPLDLVISCSLLLIYQCRHFLTDKIINTQFNIADSRQLIADSRYWIEGIGKVLL